MHPHAERKHRGEGRPARRGVNPRAGLQADGGLSQGSHRGAGVFAIVLITALSFSVWSSRGDSGDARCPGLGASDREIGAGVGWRSGPWAGCRTPPTRPPSPRTFLVGGESGAGSSVTAPEPPLA